MGDSEAWAYAVFCEPGEEYDYLVFANLDQAEFAADQRQAEIIPLYTREVQNGK